MSATLADACSFLFVPANRPERYAKALSSGAHAVVVDLEDAVAPRDKPAARVALEQAFAALDAAQRVRLLVRVNAAATPWRADDVAALRGLAAQGLEGVMIPKAESAKSLQDLAAVVGPDCKLVPLIESVAGLTAVDEIAAGPQVLRLAFGNLDFQADAGLACEPDEAELAPVRLAVVLASRRADLSAPIDGVSPSIEDKVRLASDAARGRRGGFGAKMCIHPSHVTIVNAAFAPSAAELEWAQRVVAAFEAAGSGVFSLDGRMVDAPVLRLAQRTLAKSHTVWPVEIREFSQC